MWSVTDGFEVLTLTMFAELLRAVGHCQCINSKLAIYDEHCEGNKAALTHLECAMRSYRVAVKLVHYARSHTTKTLILV